jgi:hypothetical protein
MTTQIRPSVLENTSVTAGTYGGASQVPRYVVDAQGRITNAANVNITIASSSVTGTFPSTSITGLATSATTDTTNASNITSGTLGSARLPSSGIAAGIYGGLSSSHATFTVDVYGRITSVSNTAIAIASGAVSGLAASATTDTTNASNIASGTLAAGRLPTSGVTGGSYGGAATVGTFTVDGYGRLTSASNVSIAISYTQVSGLATSATTDATNASNISSGTLNAARLPYTMNQSVGTTNNVQFNSLGVGTAASGTAGEIRATNNVTAYYSDARLKEFLGTIPNALEKVLSLNGYYFVENARAKELGYNNDARQVGVSAQEVEAVLPEVITDAPINANVEGSDYKTVYYDKLIPLLIEAIKEQQKQIDELKNK